MGKIVITGASGQYGQGVTDRLVALGRAADLILITRTPDKLAHRAAQGCTVRHGDFDRPETLAAALAGAERMLLISGTRVGARVVQHEAAITAAAAAGVRHIAYTSFIALVPGNPAIVKLDHEATEALIRASGMAWTMLRDAHYADAMIVNAGPNFIRSGVWLTSSAGGKEAMVWRDDCIDCAVAVLTGEGHEGQAYDITGPQLQDFAEVAALMTQITGRTVQLVETDDDGMYAMWDAMGVPRKPVDDQSIGGIPWNSEDMVTFEQAVREGWLAIKSDDVERLLGRPARSVQQMIEAHAEMLRSA